MLTFTLSVVVALLGLIGLAVGYWLGYRTGYVDGAEDASGKEDEWVVLQAGKGSAAYSGGSMMGGTVHLDGKTYVDPLQQYTRATHSGSDRS